MTTINIETLVIPPVYSNCYVVDDGNSNAIVIDPGGVAPEILNLLRQKNLNVEAILNTHGHIDHIGANAELRRETKAPITIHESDAEMLGSSILCGAEWMGIPFEEHAQDSFFIPGEIWDTGHFKFHVIHTPGHSPGSVCLVMPEAKIVFSGDLVFMDSIGRSDLPGGNTPTLMKSLREFLKFPDDYKVYPGHGTPTTVGRERRENPYLKSK